MMVIALNETICYTKVGYHSVVSQNGIFKTSVLKKLYFLLLSRNTLNMFKRKLFHFYEAPEDTLIFLFFFFVLYGAY